MKDEKGTRLGDSLFFQINKLRRDREMQKDRHREREKVRKTSLMCLILFLGRHNREKERVIKRDKEKKRRW